MAGRGRGFGRGRGMSFSMESLSFGKGEKPPGSTLTPPPIYPPVRRPPVPLRTGPKYDYMLALKQEFRRAMRESPYFIKTEENKKDIQRYSDKYQVSQQDNNTWEPDWRLFPAELKIRKASKKRVTPNLKGKKQAADVLKTLENLEKEEENPANKGEEKTGEKVEEKKEKNKEEEEEQEDDLDDEDIEEEDEEETDYNLNYFDNGEEYDNDEDDTLEEEGVY